MAFSDEEVKNVWRKALIVQDNDPALWRKDQCGAWIGWNFYGNRDSVYGWEIDHLDVNTNNNNLGNLRPLQWFNNANRQDGRLTCPVIANGINNIKRW